MFKSNLAIDNISHKYKPGLQPARAFDRKCPKKALRGRSARRAKGVRQGLPEAGALTERLPLLVPEGHSLDLLEFHQLSNYIL